MKKRDGWSACINEPDVDHGDVYASIQTEELTTHLQLRASRFTIQVSSTTRKASPPSPPSPPTSLSFNCPFQLGEVQLELNWSQFRMLRTTIPRTLLRPLSTAPTRAARAQSLFKPCVSEHAQFTSRLCTLSSKRPHAIASSIHKLNLRSSSKYDKPDTKLEQKVGNEKIVANPELVSTTSSTHALFSELGTKDPEKETDMSAGIVADLVSLTTHHLKPCFGTDPRRENNQRYIRPF